MRSRERMQEGPLALDDPRYHVTNLRKILSAVIDYARKDVKEISDPKAQALFETTTEMLIGIRRAFEAFDQRT
jgi:hypothetical protein